ncbi:MAG: transglycosylase SLT domain-containing protein [Lutibacter sp.]|uniref:transglycosylase SLT domain-containing protein n=1 Tax=Lutibacter sp. TaxID=1925666 RepID=UPI001A0A4DBA|nr:transglycosylase SLT domain-containing protein [Lutibacter sp.]NOR27529.1 transglycosylase SLT domain-containing protein [Lutibacter sp.]
MKIKYIVLIIIVLMIYGIVFGIKDGKINNLNKSILESKTKNEQIEKELLTCKLNDVRLSLRNAELRIKQVKIDKLINIKKLQWVKKKANFRIQDDFLIDIILEAEKYDNGLLILAIIAKESNFRQYAHHLRMNARGLTQIRPYIWFDELKQNDIIDHSNELWDYKKNIEACNYILNDYFKRYKTLKKVLTKYSGNANMYKEKVTKNLKELEKI